MTRIVWVKTLLQAGIEAGELAGKDIGSQPREFGQIEVKLNQKIGRGSSPLVRPIGNRQRRSPQSLDLLQNFTLGVVTLFGEQEDH